MKTPKYEFVVLDHRTTNSVIARPKRKLAGRSETITWTYLITINTLKTCKRRQQKCFHHDYQIASDPIALVSRKGRYTFESNLGERINQLTNRPIWPSKSLKLMTIVLNKQGLGLFSQRKSLNELLVVPITKHSKLSESIAVNIKEVIKFYKRYNNPRGSTIVAARSNKI